MQRVRLSAALIPSFVLLVACGDDVTSVDTDASSGSETGETTDEPTTDTPTTADTSSSGTTVTTVDPDSSSSAGEESSSSGGADESSSSGGETAVCGDDAIGGDEVCDGSDLSDETCESQGFDAGELSCLKNCSAFDTTACITFTCGNEEIEGREVCDGSELANQTCESQGFDAGTLACAKNCGSYDTSGCTVFTCGNDEIEGVEVCDGSDISNQTCESQGFDAGTLGCANDCSGYDTSGCIDYICGDDSTDPNETCDGADLNGESCVSLGFDDGVLGCAADCGGYDTSACITWVCGDDVTDPNEFCDGADIGDATCESEGFDEGDLGCAADCGDYDTSGCVTWECGNSILEPNEECDRLVLGGQTCVGLGAVVGTLSCDLDCGFNLGSCAFQVNEIEPNDDGAVAVNTNDFSVANAQPFTDDVFIAAAINPAGDDDVFAITNTSTGYARLRVETFGAGGLGTCAAIDTVVEIRTAANTVIASDDEAGINSCSLLSNLMMAPGETLYVRVVDYLDNDVIPSYFLHVQLDQILCGDGVAGYGETCDDNNTDDGDGCSSTCVYEDAIVEIEPNATNAEADTAALAGVVSDGTGTTVFRGAIPTLGDLDRYRVDVAATGFYRFETFSSLNDCSGINTTLRLFDAAGTQIIADTINTGISTCSAITFPLAAGTYYAQVEETGNNALIPGYLLEVARQADLGAETEPNETSDAANTNIQTAGTEVYVFGDHALNVDSDFYAIDVPQGGSLRLEIIEGDRTVETCEALGIDSRLTLFSPALTQLVDDDDEGRGYCSMIDGTGTAALDAGAHNLPAGTYFAQVRASSFAQASAAGQFTYRLVATVRTP